MAKNAIQDWSTSQTNNTDIAGFDISEGCSPSGINDAIRSLMAQVATSLSGIDASIITGTPGGTGVLAMFNADGDLVAATGVDDLSIAANKTLNFGGTFSIVSDGTNTTLTETGAGNYRNRGQNIIFTNADGTATFLFMADGGAVDAYHNNVRRLSTTATGVQVVGDVDADSFSGAGVITSGTLSGSNSTTVASSGAVKFYVDSAVAAAPGVGVGQTWQDVSGSRVNGTSYQNTTGDPIMVVVDALNNADFQVSTDNSTWVTIHSDLTYGAQVIVPDQHYYRVTGATGFNTWVELR